MRRRRRTRRRGLPENLSLSFLDAISCGFGAIVLLLVLTKIGEPAAMEQARTDLGSRIAVLERQIFEIRGDTQVLERRLTTRTRQLSDERERLARLRGDLSRLRGEFAGTQELSEVQDTLEGRLLAARQQLTEEMERLQARQRYRRPPDAPVGGIPVDSEYIIFVIDTSGSMFQNAWPRVLEKMAEVLEIYPRVKGIQVMNDMGQYMFSGYSGRWIPDTPGRRRVILQQLRNWNAFSNSSPVEGITRAIRTFAAPDKKISVYVFGDEFTGESIQVVLDTVAQINPKDAAGEPRVRIHAVGFPVIFSVPGVSEVTGIRFATLMRALAEQNHGSFVGLNSVHAGGAR